MPSSAPDRHNSAGVYLPGLHALRAAAAFIVMITHMEEWKRYAGVPNFWALVQGGATEAVRLFFVISGFLITYLLLFEASREGRFSIPRFYARRALRIYPLYFAVFFVAWFVVPLVGDFGGGHAGQIIRGFNAQIAPFRSRVLLLFLVMAPNVAFVTCPLLAGAAHLWSIGSEEQLYLVWPWLLRWFRKIPVFALAVIAISKLALEAMWAPHLTILPLEFMAAGAIGAHIAFSRPFTVRRMFNPPLTWITVPLLLALIFAKAPSLWATPLRCVGYTWVVLAVIHGAVPLSVVEDERVVWLGKISYGIYMWHPVASLMAILLAERLVAPLSHPIGLAFFYAVSVSATLLIAGGSYRYFERRFLRVKFRVGSVSSAPI